MTISAISRDGDTGQTEAGTTTPAAAAPAQPKPRRSRDHIPAGLTVPWLVNGATAVGTTVVHTTGVGGLVMGAGAAAAGVGAAAVARRMRARRTAASRTAGSSTGLGGGRSRSGRLLGGSGRSGGGKWGGGAGSGSRSSGLTRGGRGGSDGKTGVPSWRASSSASPATGRRQSAPIRAANSAARWLGLPTIGGKSTAGSAGGGKTGSSGGGSRGGSRGGGVLWGSGGSSRGGTGNGGRGGTGNGGRGGLLGRWTNGQRRSAGGNGSGNSATSRRRSPARRLARSGLRWTGGQLRRAWQWYRHATQKPVTQPVTQTSGQQATGNTGATAPQLIPLSTSTSGENVMSGNNNGAGAGIGPIKAMMEAAEQINRAVRAWDPQGMMEVLAVYERWPEVMEELTRAWGVLHDKAQTQFPQRTVVTDLIAEVHRTQRVVTNATEQIAPTFRAVHRKELEHLEDPRNAMWDLRANQGVR